MANQLIFLKTGQFKEGNNIGPKGRKNPLEPVAWVSLDNTRTYIALQEVKGDVFGLMGYRQEHPQL
jgi:hypothetical protein